MRAAAALTAVLLPAPASAAGQCGSTEDGYDCNDKDGKINPLGTRAADAAACCDQCVAHEECSDYVYRTAGLNSGLCYLKMSCADRAAKAGSTHGTTVAPPAPPAPPGTDSYICVYFKGNQQCEAAPSGTSGASSKAVCEKTCTPTPPAPPSPPTPPSPGGKGWAYYDAAGPYKVLDKKIGTNVTRIWHPSGAAPAGGWPVYQFVCGTGQEPRQYGASMKHIASHGIFVIVNFMDFLPGGGLTRTEEAYKSVMSGAVAGVKVDTSRMAAGGHSGGGPDAAMHAGNHPGLHFVGQHAAATPGWQASTLTKKNLARITGTILQLCGTEDLMPFCGCSAAKNNYLNKYPPTAKTVLVKAPDGHVAGTEGASGNKYEGGFQTAFLSYVLLGDTAARAALNEGGQRSGYSVTDNL